MTFLNHLAFRWYCSGSYSTVDVTGARLYNYTTNQSRHWKEFVWKCSILQILHMLQYTASFILCILGLFLSAKTLNITHVHPALLQNLTVGRLIFTFLQIRRKSLTNSSTFTHVYGGWCLLCISNLLRLCSVNAVVCAAVGQNRAVPGGIFKSTIADINKVSGLLYYTALFLVKCIK